MQIHPRRTMLFLLSLVATFVLIRAYLHVSPDTDLNVGPYNIHHLFTGLLFITFGGIPLVLVQNGGWLLDMAAVAFGVGLSLALDEWVYLVATDGSNASYLLPVSFWGGVVMVGVAGIYTVVLYRIGRRRNKPR